MSYCDTSYHWSLGAPFKSWYDPRRGRDIFRWELSDALLIIGFVEYAPLKIKS